MSKMASLGDSISTLLAAVAELLELREKCKAQEGVIREFEEREKVEQAQAQEREGRVAEPDDLEELYLR